MKKSELRQIIKEEIRNTLNEIGEGVKPYSWRIDYKSDDEVRYGFETDNNVDYQVSFESFGEGETWDVSFAAREIGTSDRFSTSVITNRGEMYRVMSTVFDIVKDFINDYPDTFQLTFDPSQTGDDASTKDKRAKLYLAYFKKQMPTSKVYQGEQGEFIVQLKHQY